MASYAASGELVLVDMAGAPVTYRLESVVVRNIREVRGSITCSDYGVISQAFEAGQATLVIKGGIRVPVVVTSWSPGLPAQIALGGVPIDATGQQVAL